MRKSVLVVVLLAVTACRPVSKVDRADPIDFLALPGTTVFDSDSDVLARWDTTLKTFYDAAPDENFSGLDGVPIHYRVFGRGRSNAVVLVAGRTEPIVKFAEVIDDLVRENFAVYALDVRGQGASGRMLPNTQKGYVLNFHDYVADLDTFIQTVVKKDAPTHVMLLSHSMGGGITTLYADEHPEELTALAMTSPMLEINTGSFPAPVAFSLGATACSATDGTAYAIGYGDYKEDTDFANDTVTSSQPRWAWKQQLLRERPEQRIGGVTWNWLCQSLTGSSQAALLGKYSPVPTLILQAGADTVVKPGAQNQYCKDAPRCQLVTFDGARHEILQEKDSIRNRALEDIVKFFKVQVSK